MPAVRELAQEASPFGADAVGVSTALWGASFVALVTVLVPLLSRDVRTLRRVEAPLELPPLETEPTVPPAVH